MDTFSYLIICIFIQYMYINQEAFEHNMDEIMTSLQPRAATTLYLRGYFPLLSLFSRFVGILAARVVRKDIFFVTHTGFLFKFHID